MIDPNCAGGRGGDENDDDDDGGSCRLWIANANGGVWRTNNALAKRPQWKYLSEDFEHNSIASLELDPNDKRSNTIYAGTGEPNACGSGCEAGVGIYKSTNGGERWSGPFGKTAGPACGPGNPSPCEPFYNRAVGSIEVKPGDSKTIFAATGRAVRGLTSSCCGGVDALIPGAAALRPLPLAGRRPELDARPPGCERRLHGSTPDHGVAQRDAVLAARRAPGLHRPGRPEHRLRLVLRARHLALEGERQSGHVRADHGCRSTPASRPRPAGSERAEFDIVKLPAARRGCTSASAAAACLRALPPERRRPQRPGRRGRGELGRPDRRHVQDTPGYSSFNYCDAVLVRQLRVRAGPALPELGGERRTSSTSPATTGTTRTTGAR